MQTSSASSAATPRRARRNERVEFGVIYALCFVVLLAAVAVERLIGVVLRRPRHEPARSIIQEAREATGAAIPYAFMG
jgi:hypothetical protein